MPGFAKLTFVLIATFILAACGFHLRGQAGNTSIPFKEISIVGNSETAAALREYIKRQPNYQLTPELTPDGLQITVGTDIRDRQISAINNSGQVSEYRLTMRIPVSARTQNDILAENTSISLYRDLTWDDNTLLSKEQEEQQLWHSMSQDAVQPLLYRVNAAVRKQLRERAASGAATASSAAAGNAP
ncbi:LPS-assembly lipoprotein LptE [Chitinilyticum aquatile]|uniref:LPS-assembly lipoprotein LptE n=1 Tax=Chitinilyticum aquatile TaxID=362520 RepID=UPI0004053CAF|nr:LPS assembly lipoprotein LptE [Chitinilyticum aquatile]